MAEKPQNAADSYVVVARRYRPQSFGELVGQSQAATALCNAIETDRVGHAYLFTGARGVGKTSTARIFAKALNCVQGPTASPCNECDACQGVTSGDDVDVLEIDGASNRGIDEIRQLRSNVASRPSRSRYKIYIIDEVHMLTKDAFNALLKTLEEPPEHVKFIFCTTEPEKIPITVLSRCQRFDFAPVAAGEIVNRLAQIVAGEGAEVEPEVLEILARRAGGSMRDSQSLLEQLLSFTSQKVTVADVHAMLGTARGGCLLDLLDKLLARDAAAALTALDSALAEGVDAGQLGEQLLGYVRDLLVISAGCKADMLRDALPAEAAQITDLAARSGLESLMAIAQILDQTVAQFRKSMQVRALLEIAVIRICKLEDLDQLSTLVAQIKAGGTVVTSGRSQASSQPAGTQKKNDLEPVSTPAAPVSPSSPAPVSSISADRPIAEVWRQVLAEMGDVTAEMAGQSTSVATSGPNRLVVRFPAEYNLQKEACERPERRDRLEQAMAKATGKRWRIDFETSAPTAATVASPATAAPASKRQLMRELEKDPVIQKVIEMFDADLRDVDQ